jgi:hypothetical protein
LVGELGLIEGSSDMNWGITGILIVFGIFLVLLILNPNLSCFGKRVKSPFTPLLRKRKRRVKTNDYDFRLVEGGGKEPGETETPKPVPKTDDYGFRLD